MNMRKNLLAALVAGAFVEPLDMAVARPRGRRSAMLPDEGLKGCFALLTTNSLVALGQQPMPTPKGSEVVAVRLEHSLAANPVANDTAWLCELPEDCVPVDCILDSPDLDTNGSPTITISVGVLNAAKTDLDTLWITASTIGQTGSIARPTTNVLARAGTSSARRSVGLKFPAVAATFAAGTIGLTLFYRAAHFGK